MMCDGGWDNCSSAAPRPKLHDCFQIIHMCGERKTTFSYNKKESSKLECMMMIRFIFIMENTTKTKDFGLDVSQELYVRKMFER